MPLFDRIAEQLRALIDCRDEPQPIMALVAVGNECINWSAYSYRVAIRPILSGLPDSKSLLGLPMPEWYRAIGPGAVSGLMAFMASLPGGLLGLLGLSGLVLYQALCNQSHALIAL